MSHDVNTIHGKDFAVYSMGFRYAAACTTFADPAAEIAMNDQYPSGTNGGWKISRKEAFRDGKPNPSPCSLVTGRRHVLFEVSS